MDVKTICFYKKGGSPFRANLLFGMLKVSEPPFRDQPYLWSHLYRGEPVRTKLKVRPQRFWSYFGDTM